MSTTTDDNHTEKDETVINSEEIKEEKSYEKDEVEETVINSEEKIKSACPTVEIEIVDEKKLYSDFILSSGFQLMLYGLCIILFTILDSHTLTYILATIVMIYTFMLLRLPHSQNIHKLTMFILSIILLSVGFPGLGILFLLF